MDSQYHIQLLTETLGSYFSAGALAEVIAANLGQDALRYQLGAYPHFHFDNNEIARSLAYVDEEHARIGTLAQVTANGMGDPAADPAAQQRAAFGRLTHAVHDFYAHSNYVDLWLEANGGLAQTVADQINGVDAVLLQHPRLYSGSFLIWFDTLYYIPGFRRTLRRLYLRPDSHEAMNLDSPSQGPKFDYAMVAAKQRTVHEYKRARKALTEQGGEGAVARFLQG
jgi:hypothetical protein